MADLAKFLDRAMSELMGTNPTRVVNLHRGDPYDVYVGRAGHGLDGYFGNPVRMGEPCPVCKHAHLDRGATIRCFEQYARARLASDGDYRTRVGDLYGKTLGCFCSPDQCHGDVLARLAGELRGVL